MASATRKRKIDFNTGRIIKRNRKATANAFDTVAKRMTEALRKPIRTPYPPASVPGRPPHQRTGNLERGTEVIRKGFKLIVRTLQYGIWLDGGTRRMAARPFIRIRINDQKRRWTKEINNEIRKNVNEKTVK